ncbi:MAG: hypothetical protein ABJA67_15465 [Chthonomonadales bacterium]
MPSEILRVGVVDHHLNNWHADTFLRLLRGPLASEKVELVRAWESNPVGDDWCEKNSVERADTPQEAIRGVDAILLLAPDNIEDHLALAKVVLPAHKPTFIDKFLAPNSVEAEEIVDLARIYRTPIFSASALRYAVEMEEILPTVAGEKLTDGRFTGMGKWGTYGVHTLCLAMRTMGHNVVRLIDTGTEKSRTIVLEFADGRRASLDVRFAANQGDFCPWTFAAKHGDNYIGATVGDHEGFYHNLMRNVCGFFKSGKVDMSVEEALSTVQCLEAAETSRKAGGVWVKLK